MHRKGVSLRPRSPSTDQSFLVISVFDRHNRRSGEDTEYLVETSRLRMMRVDYIVLADVVSNGICGVHDDSNCRVLRSHVFDPYLIQTPERTLAEPR
jgi:hypothetical protein